MREAAASRSRAWPLAFLAPSLVIFVAFFFYPLFRIVYWGFYQQNRLGTESARWAGASTRTSSPARTSSTA